MRFGERLRELRESAGLTQQQLAEGAGVPIGSIRNYEQGHREPYWDVVYRLAPVLGVGCDAFACCVQPVVSAAASIVEAEPSTPEPTPKGRKAEAPADAEKPASKPKGRGRKAT